jgi:hypothetical protein
MFEDPTTPTFLGLTVPEWHAVGDGVPDGFQGPTFGPFVIPEDAKEKPRYYKAANIAGRILKIIVYAVAIKYLGMASGGIV